MAEGGQEPLRVVRLAEEIELGGDRAVEFGGQADGVGWSFRASGILRSMARARR